MSNSKPYKLGVAVFDEIKQKLINEHCRYSPTIEKQKYDEWVRGFESALRGFLNGDKGDNHEL